MSIDIERPVARMPGEYRPVLPDKGPGQWFRALAGVREALLDWVPEERARYTGIGMIICTTGLMAGTSLLIALNNITQGRSKGWLAIWAMLWALVIIVLDRWLIASTHGMLEHKFRMLGARLLISLLMGSFIAEPLVVQFFAPAISSEIQKMQEDDLNTQRKLWVDCNPVTAVTPAKGCDHYQLNIADGPQALIKQRTDLQNELRRLTTDVAGIQKEVKRLQVVARKECAGGSGPGFSGQRGKGPLCDQNLKDVQETIRTSRLVQKQKARDVLTDQISGLATKITDRQQDYEQTIKRGIDERLAVWSAKQNGRGLLDQVRALHRLAGRDTFVLVQEWLLRLLLITVDCAPVLAKLLSPNTTYDILVNRQQLASRRMHEERLRLVEKHASADVEVETAQTEHDRNRLIEEIDERDRETRSEHQRNVNLEVDRLAARLLAQSAPRLSP